MGAARRIVGVARGGAVEGEVVVVFNRLQGCLLTVHAQVMDWHGEREEARDRVDHTQTRSEDGHQRDAGRGNGLGLIFVAKRRLALHFFSVLARCGRVNTTTREGSGCVGRE